jgi:hypothetical protein
MDESTQERLFVENPGRISPPEPGLYLGTSGWSYADWEGSLYPEGLPAAARLAEYANHYATVEIDSTFYGTPRRSTVERWREIVPEGFLFAAKFPQEVTHERKLVNVRSEAEGFVHTMQALEDRLGPLLLQLPPDFTVEGMGVLEDFLITSLRCRGASQELAGLRPSGAVGRAGSRPHPDRLPPDAPDGGGHSGLCLHPLAR